MSAKTPRWLITVSKVISNFFNPITSLVIYFLYYSSEFYTAEGAWEKFLPVLLILIIPITAWIIWNVKKGNYSNMDVSNRNQRKSLYIFIICVSTIFLVVDYFLHENLDITVLYLLLLLVIMHISNYFIKSSMHTALNVYVAALFFAINPTIGVLWFGIAVIVGATRVIIKRHTIPEVLMGAFLAVVVSFMYLYHNIQNTY